MTRGGKRKNQTGRPKKPYGVKRMSVPEPLVSDVLDMIDQFKDRTAAAWMSWNNPRKS